MKKRRLGSDAGLKWEWLLGAGMGITRLWRQLSSRWWLILVLGTIGLAAGLVFTADANRGRSARFEARAVITFKTDDQARDRTFLVQQLTDASELARDVNAEIMREGATVTANEQSAELVFTARAESRESAEERVSTMRSSLLEAMVEEESFDVEARRQAIIEEAEAIVAQLNELAPPEEAEPEPETTSLDPAQQATLDGLNSEVAALTQQRTQLAVDLVLAEGGNERVGSAEQIQTEIDLISTRLEELYAEIAAITEATGETSERTVSSQVLREETPLRDETTAPEIEDPEQVENEWVAAALSARYDELENEFEGLYVTGRTEEIIEDLVPVSVVDLTPERVSPVKAGSFGLSAGFFLAVVLVIAESRLRGRIWVGADLPTRFFGELPSAASTTRGRLGKRVVAAKGRLRGTQELRNLIVGVLDRSAEAPILGFSGVGLDHEEVAELAFLMAGSLAAADRSVLFVDFDFSDRRDHAVSEGRSVADLVTAARSDPEAGAADMKRSLTDLAEVSPNLRALPTGTLSDEPVAVVLTSAFRGLMDAARASSDVVLAVMPSIDDPVTKALSQRVDHVIAVCALGQKGRSAIARFESVTIPGSAGLVGAVLVRGHRPSGSSTRSSLGRLLRRSSRTYELTAGSGAEETSSSGGA